MEFQKKTLPNIMRLIFTLFLLLFVAESFAQETSLRLSPSMVLGDGELISVQPPTDGYSAALQVFHQSNGEWSHSTTVLVPEADRGSGFGLTAVLDGDLLAVGAPYYQDGTGRVFLFQRGETGWKTAAIEIGPDPTSEFGYALDLHGDMLVIGAPGSNSVHVIQGAGSDAPSTYTLLADMPGEDDGFGISVATDGEDVYVGAPNRDDLAGAIYVFSLANNGYMQEAELTSPGNYRLGRSLFVLGSGNVIAPALRLSANDLTQRGNGPSRRISTTGPVLELMKGDTGAWSTSIALDSLTRIQGFMFGQHTIQAGKTFLVVNEDTGLNKYAQDGGAWTLNASLEPNEAESGLGDAIAVR